MEQSLQEDVLLHILHELARMNIGGALQVVTQGEFILLFMLRRMGGSIEQPADPVNVSRLAAVLEVTPASVSRMLRGLEARGYLERVTDAANRRKTFVKLTERGRSLFVREDEEIRALAGRVFSRMGEADMQALLSLSQRLHGILDEEAGRLSCVRAAAH